MAAYSEDVGRRLREARARNRPDLTSQEAAAHEVGISGKQYGRWERGESEPRSDKWEALATMLRIPVEDLRGKPPLAPEEELRAQLDRIEAKLDQLLDALPEPIEDFQAAFAEADEQPTATRPKRRASTVKSQATR